MAKYYRQQGETKQRKFLRRFRPFVVLVFVSSLFVVGWFAYDIYAQTENSVEPVTTQATTSTIAARTQIQSTPYFQIQLPLKWRAVVNESRDGYYVYREHNGQYVEQDLVIEVNDPNQVNLATTRVNRAMLVQPEAMGRLSIIDSSLEHCKKFAGNVGKQLIVTMKNASFPCNPDSSLFEVVLSQPKGTNIIELIRPNGSKAYYKITYRDLSATPAGRDLTSIVRSFETR